MSLLEALKYLILGIIQGITEVLPISSSGHVEIAKALIHLQADEGLLFLILVNSGSLFAFVFLYRKRLIALIRDFVLYIVRKRTRDETKENFEYALKIVIASIPAAILGIVAADWFDSLLSNYNVLISGVGLLLTGSVLVLIGQNRHRNGTTVITTKDSIIMGCAQALALFPGVSRSGMTTSSAICNGVGVNSALDFSFLMYIPVSVGTVALSMYKGLNEGFNLPGNHYILYYVLAFLGAIVATYFAFKMIFSIFRSRKLRYFGFYCLLMSLISIGIYIIRL
ncbi:MAG: undecaprenyl-diphosphate phosphatase [Candidatus Izemoplasmatales bacterium]|nr:undecaprenyl-diphosphate phosphatase [Candidatus Izemoplasmatales bacterium]